MKLVTVFSSVVVVRDEGGRRLPEREGLRREASAGGRGGGCRDHD